MGFWKASVTLCGVCAESLNLTGRSLVKEVLMLLVQEENGLFGSLGAWPLSVQILNSLHVLTCFYLQVLQLILWKYRREQGKEQNEAQSELQELGKGGEEGTMASHQGFRQQVSQKWGRRLWPAASSCRRVNAGRLAWWKRELLQHPSGSTVLLCQSTGAVFGVPAPQPSRVALAVPHGTAKSCPQWASSSQPHPRCPFSITAFLADLSFKDFPGSPCVRCGLTWASAGNSVALHFSWAASPRAEAVRAVDTSGKMT